MATPKVKVKQKVGRKPFIVDEEVLKKAEALAFTGQTMETIATNIEISYGQFFRKLKQYPELGERIKRGRERGAAMVGTELLKLCRDGNLGAMIWYEKTRCGRSERIDVNNTGTVTHAHVGLSRVDELLAGFKSAGREDRDDEAPMPN